MTFRFFGALVEGLQVVSEIISRYAALENLYLRRSSSMKDQLRDSIIATYAAILIFFSRCRKNFDLELGRRLARSITQNAENVVVDQLKTISRNDESVMKLTRLVDAECSQNMEASQASPSTTINDLNTGVNTLRSLSAETVQKLEFLLKSVQDPFIRSMVQISALSESIIGSADQQERQEVLRWLSNVQYRNHHRGLHKKFLEGTGLWLLGTHQYTEWRQSSVPSVLWLHGIRK